MKKSNAQLIAETRTKLDSVMNEDKINESIGGIITFIASITLILGIITNWVRAFRKAKTDPNLIALVKETIECLNLAKKATTDRNLKLLVSELKRVTEIVKKYPNVNIISLKNVASKIDSFADEINSQQLSEDDWSKIENFIEEMINTLVLFLPKEEIPISTYHHLVGSGLFGPH